MRLKSTTPNAIFLALGHAVVQNPSTTTWRILVPKVKIVIQAARLDVLQEMPGASQGRLELSISAKDHEAAEKFVADLHQHDEKSV